MDIFSSIEEEASEKLNLSGESGNGNQKDKSGYRKKGDKMTIHTSRKKKMEDINNRSGSEDSADGNEVNDEAENEADDEIDDEMKCKLDSKSKALLILSQDLMSCQRERDEYKLMAEQIRDKYSRLKKVLLTTSTEQLMMSSQGLMGSASIPLTQVLLELTDQNKFLLFEVEELKSKLSDSESDLKLLREQLRNLRNIQRFESGEPDGEPLGTFRTESTMSSQGLIDEAILEQLESFRNKVLLMERDLQLILEEKEELICSRDNYKRKVQRLNQQLNQILNAKTDQSIQEGKNSILDIDSVVTENLFLKEKLKALEDEKKLNVSTMNKYKALLEKSSKSPSGGYNTILNSITRSLNPVQPSFKISEENELPLATLDVMSPNTQVISSKQIQTFISSHELNSLPVNEHSITRLRSLLLALFEAFCDKSSALIIHKKNNKLLGRRINELEDKIRELVAKEKVMLLTSRDLHLDQEIERQRRELDLSGSSFDDSRVGTLDSRIGTMDSRVGAMDSCVGSSLLDATTMPLPTETHYGNPDHDQDLEEIDRVIQSLRAEVERVGIDDEENWRQKEGNDSIDVTRVDIGSEMRATTEVIAKEFGSLSGTSRTSSTSSEYSDPDAGNDSRLAPSSSERRRMRRQTERIDDDDEFTLTSNHEYTD